MHFAEANFGNFGTTYIYQRFGLQFTNALAHRHYAPIYLGRPIVVLGGDGTDEGLDVELRGAGLLAGRVGALQAPVGLPQRGALAQRSVLDVVKVLVELVVASGKNEERVDGKRM